MGGCGPHDQALILRLRFIIHVGQRRRGRTLARTVGVVGGSPGLKRWSATGANDEVDDGNPPGTDNSSWGGSNQRLLSSSSTADSGQIPAMRCSHCSVGEVGWF